MAILLSRTLPEPGRSTHDRLEAVILKFIHSMAYNVFRKKALLGNVTFAAESQAINQKLAICC